MNEEISHIAQWVELSARAKNHQLTLTYDENAFYLSKDGRLLGRYLSFFDLRAGISDYVAGVRQAADIQRIASLARAPRWPWPEDDRRTEEN